MPAPVIVVRITENGFALAVAGMARNPTTKSAMLALFNLFLPQSYLFAYALYTPGPSGRFRAEEGSPRWGSRRSPGVSELRPGRGIDS